MFSSDTQQQKIEITDLKPVLAAGDTSVTSEVLVNHRHA